MAVAADDPGSTSRSHNQEDAAELDLNDPRYDFCNSFWGNNDEGYHRLMRRVACANQTTDELRSYWKERAAIEEDYARRLNKLSKTSLGSTEIGQLKESLDNLLAETAQQASFHEDLVSELRGKDVEQQTVEFASRLNNMKKGLQASVEKSFRNKGLQEGHVDKARERYEQDCLKLNSYHANAEITQGREREKLLEKIDRTQQSIVANEQDFRQFVRVLEGTSQKWEREWKNFCDHFQDLEEERLAITKDAVWGYANAISVCCVADDESCERIREKLEQFEPQVDMINFAHSYSGQGGSDIYEPPRFVNYSAGEYPQVPPPRKAHFTRISSRPPPSAASEQPPAPLPEVNTAVRSDGPIGSTPTSATMPNGNYGTYMQSTADKIQFSDALKRMTLQDPPVPPVPSSAAPAERKIPFGGVALPGMTSAPAPNPKSPPPVSASVLPERSSSVGPGAPAPPTPTMSMPEPRVPSRQGPPSPIRDVNDDDPMARALADLRREPPPPSSVRRAPSSKRANSVLSQNGRAPGAGPLASQSQPIRSASPAPGMAQSRMSYQQPPTQPPVSHRAQQSVDMTLSPPAAGHTAAQLAKSMEDFHRASSRGPGDKRGSVNYSNYADDVVGAHPTSRPSTPSGQQRAPSPSAAMMRPPHMPPSPVADEVLSKYHQALPGERSRSRAGSIRSKRSRANSYVESGRYEQEQMANQGRGREAFAGIGAGGGRSPSPQPPAFRSPSPSPAMQQQGSIPPSNLGISLDEKGGVAHDSMAEAYRRQYQEQQQQRSSTGPPQPAYGSRPGSQYGGPTSSQLHSYSQGALHQQQHQQQQPPQQQSQPLVKSPSTYTSPQVGAGRPPSGYGQYPQQAAQQQQHYQSPQQQSYPQQQYQSPPQPTYQAQQPAYAPPPAQQQQQPSYAGTNGYGHPQQQQAPRQQQQQYAPQSQYQQQAPAQQPQQQQYAGYGRAPSPQPQAQPQHQPPQPQSQSQYGGQSYQQANRSPSPQPNVPPPNAAPTGQWSTTGLPVLFYVKALYDYTAQSSAEFDFQSGDIIAVTSTPEDGWWSGELLDEARRLPGRNDFPSNFVCLF